MAEKNNRPASCSRCPALKIRPLEEKRELELEVTPDDKAEVALELRFLAIPIGNMIGGVWNGIRIWNGKGNVNWNGIGN